MSTRISIAVLLALSFTTQVNADDNWPQFRGPAARGVSEAKQVPTEWAKDKNIAWQVDLPGVAWSQPIVWGDKIFVTTAITENQQKPRAWRRLRWAGRTGRRTARRLWTSGRRLRS